MNRQVLMIAISLVVGLAVGFFVGTTHPRHRYVHLGGAEMYDENTGRVCVGVKSTTSGDVFDKAAAEPKAGQPVPGMPGYVFDKQTASTLPYCGEE
jgi:hypothetical protein